MPIFHANPIGRIRSQIGKVRWLSPALLLVTILSIGGQAIAASGFDWPTSPPDAFYPSSGGIRYLQANVGHDGLHPAFQRPVLPAAYADGTSFCPKRMMAMDKGIYPTRSLPRRTASCRRMSPGASTHLASTGSACVIWMPIQRPSCWVRRRRRFVCPASSIPWLLRPARLRCSLDGSTPSDSDTYRLAYADRDLLVWERLDAHARIRWAGNAVVIKDPGAMLKAAVSTPSDPNTVLLDTATPSGFTSRAATEPYRMRCRSMTVRHVMGTTIL